MGSKGQSSLSSNKLSSKPIRKITYTSQKNVSSDIPKTSNLPRGSNLKKNIIVMEPEEEEDDTDITAFEIRPAIFGLYAWITMEDNIQPEIDRKGFMYKLKAYGEQWCFVFESQGKKKETLTPLDYRNVIYSFIRRLLSKPMTPSRHINLDVFKLLMVTSPNKTEYIVEDPGDITNIEMLELLNRIYAEASFMHIEESSKEEED